MASGLAIDGTASIVERVKKLISVLLRRIFVEFAWGPIICLYYHKFSPGDQCKTTMFSNFLDVLVWRTNIGFNLWGSLRCCPRCQYLSSFDVSSSTQCSIIQVVLRPGRFWNIIL